jgi:hypothetical protein
MEIETDDVVDNDSDRAAAPPVAPEPAGEPEPAAAMDESVAPAPPYNHGVTFLAPAYAQLGGHGAKCACGGDLPERTTEWIVYAEKWSTPVCRRCSEQYPELLALADRVNALNLPRSPAAHAIVPGDRIANETCNRSGSPTSRRRFDLAFDWGRGTGRPVLKAFGRSADEWAKEQPELHALLDGTTYVKPVVPPPAPPSEEEIRSKKRAALRHQIAIALVGIDDHRRKADPAANAERLLTAIESLIEERLAKVVAKRKAK